ncbi:hypothetical protein J4457_06285 [Candidatus Woesearchaeota archaeon]|nr:hypothetical protein [Candidatus Woesearchaeota archaeon]
MLVERFLSEHRGDLFSKAAIIRALGGRINNKSLSTILDYLEASNKIMQGPKGILWIVSEGKKAKLLMKEAIVF